MSGQGDNPKIAKIMDSGKEMRPAATAAQCLPGLSLEQTETIVASVLKYVAPNDLAHYAAVGPLWQHAVVTRVGIPLFIGNRSPLWPATVTFDRPYIVGQLATPMLTISELTHPVEQVTPVKYATVLKKLWIDGATTPANLTVLVANPANVLINLTDFAIGWTTMNSVSLNGLALMFPSLKILRVWSLASRDTAIESTKNWDLGLKNVVTLLQQAKYPRLRKLFFTFVPIHIGQHAQTIVVAIVNCIAAHKTTLRKILLDFIGVTSENDPTGEIIAPNVPVLLERCQGLSLTHGMVRCDQDVRANPKFSILNQIITQSVPSVEERRHVGLESVYLVTGLHPAIPGASLLAHQQTLTSIEMDISLPDGSLDCSAFHGCTQLKVLTLIGRLRRATRSDDHTPNILETPQLPASLESLRLIRLRISTANADFLATRTAAAGGPLSKLIFVELQEIGQTDGLGLSLAAIQLAWQNLALQKLAVCQAINVDSLDKPSLPHTDGSLALVQNLGNDSDYAFGLCLKQNSQTGEPYYQVEWGTALDEENLWKFNGSDPKLYFSSKPIDLDALDAHNYASTDEMEDGDEEEGAEFYEGDEAAAIMAALAQFAEQLGENDADNDMEYEEDPDDEDDGGGDGGEDDEWEPAPE